MSNTMNSSDLQCIIFIHEKNEYLVRLERSVVL
jgi:hypothetical protein